MKYYRMIALFWSLVLIWPAGVAIAQDQVKPVCLGVEQCKFSLNEKALKINVAQRITANMKAKGATEGPLLPDQVEVLKAIPFQIGETKWVAVKIKINTPGRGQGPSINFLVVDPSASIYLTGLQNLATGQNLAAEAMTLARWEELPKDFGHLILEGQGRTEIVMVSDPLCPFCSKAYKFFSENLARIKTVRLVHFPLDSHQGADTACAVLIYAQKNNLPLPAFTNFAYLELKPVPLAGEGQERIRQGQQGVLKQFFAKFPELEKALGSDVEQALAKLLAETSKDIEIDRKASLNLGIDSTPIIFVDGLRIDGFNQKEIEAILSRKN